MLFRSRCARQAQRKFSYLAYPRSSYFFRGHDLPSAKSHFSQICLLARLLMSSLSTTPMLTPFVRVSPNSLHTSGSVAVQRSAMRSAIIRRAVTRESFITLLSISSSVLGLYYSTSDCVHPTDHRRAEVAAGGCGEVPHHLAASPPTTSIMC